MPSLIPGRSRFAELMRDELLFRSAHLKGLGAGLCLLGRWGSGVMPEGLDRDRSSRLHYFKSSKSSSQYSNSRLDSAGRSVFSTDRSCVRRILPEIVLGNSPNSMRRIRL